MPFRACGGRISEQPTGGAHARFSDGIQHRPQSASEHPHHHPPSRTQPHHHEAQQHEPVPELERGPCGMVDSASSSMARGDHGSDTSTAPMAETPRAVTFDNDASAEQFARLTGGSAILLADTGASYAGDRMESEPSPCVAAPRPQRAAQSASQPGKCGQCEVTHGSAAHAVSGGVGIAVAKSPIRGRREGNVEAVASLGSFLSRSLLSPLRALMIRPAGGGAASRALRPRRV